jgi:hypothetical protein
LRRIGNYVEGVVIEHMVKVMDFLLMLRLTKVRDVVYSFRSFLAVFRAFLT